MNDLKKRIIEISYKNKSAHIGSCLTSVELIDAVYQMKRSDEVFILSNGHAGLALYVVLEKYLKMNAESLFIRHGTHPNREEGIYCSTGSLGHGVGVALGMAMCDKSRNVYCMVSDGECMEGSFWETLRIASDNQISNLIILVNSNGYGAYKSIEQDRLEWQIASFVQNRCPQVSFNRTEIKEPHLFGIDAHYKVLTEDEYKDILKYYETA